MSAELEVRPPGAQAFRVPIEPVPFRIGRSPDNHLVLRDNRASRAHALIRRDGESLIIEDAGSRNGIEINGLKCESHPLRAGDTVTFGVEESYELVYHPESDTGLRTQASHGGLRKLRSMLEVARSLAGSLSIDHVLGAVVDAAIDITNSQRGFLLLTVDGALATRIARQTGGRSLPLDDLNVPASLLNQALRNRSELLTMRFDDAHNLVDTASLNVVLRSIVCVPLIKVRATEMTETAVVGTIADTIGLLYMDSRESHAELTSTSRDLLQSLAIEASFVLENARLLEQERKKLQLEQELNIAQSIQRDLLPDAAQFPSKGWLTAAGLSIPSRQVGGDYFDLIPAGPDRYDIVMADVSGKGVSSALLAGLLQGAFVMSTAEQIPPAIVCERLNRFMIERTNGLKYMTIFLGTIFREAPMQWANAGHCSPLLIKSTGESYELMPTGMPVGMLEEAHWHDAAAQLHPGDTLLLYTDGVSEACRAGGEQYGLERLAALAIQYRASSPGELTKMIQGDIAAFTQGEPQRDDLTLLVLRMNQ